MVRRQEIREHLTRLLESEQFVASRSVTKLLTFCVDTALAGDEEALKETTIGVFCFGRTPGYDTKQDPIVRVTARRLRTKLELFYQKEGEGQKLKIVLPKGTYVPRFDYRSNKALTIETSPDPEPMTLDPLPTSDGELISPQEIFAAIDGPVILRSSWLRPANWSFLIGALIISSTAILTHTGILQHVTSAALQYNPLHRVSFNTEDASSGSGTPDTEKQIEMRRQAATELFSLGTPNATSSARSTHVHPITAAADDIAVSVEPRL
jgi:hypothetical protein